MRTASAFVLVAAALMSTACKPTPASTPAATAAPAEAATTAPAAQAQAAPAAGSVFTGSIAETMDSGGYTYARLSAAGKDDAWVAAPQFDAKVGETVSVSLDMPMAGFESKTLKRTFPMLYFVSEVARNGKPLTGAGGAAPSAPSMASSHGGGAGAPKVEKMDPPAGGLSVADVFAKKATLGGKPVVVRGTVVKFNGGIMDRNWIHLQDGSGSAEAKTNDLTITTDAEVKVGDVVTMSGVVGLERDFGAGYAYDVILEKATRK